MVDIDTFNDEQKQFLSQIIDDFGGPTQTGNLLYVKNLLYGLKPDWELQTFHDQPDLKADIEVCVAALNYLKIKSDAL